ncbi:hypothetical protein FRB99_006399 [Tulasnella sp. 403]|nr:hypothetical protein FRB99_006399 [Tulasnella sp. 403]
METPDEASPVPPLLQLQDTGPSRPTSSYTSRTYAYAQQTPPERQPSIPLGSLAYNHYNTSHDFYAPATYDDSRSRSASPEQFDGAHDRSYDHIMGDAHDRHAPAYKDTDEWEECNADDARMEKMASEYEAQRLRYGAPPEEPTVRRRTKLKKKVILTNGNLVIDLPIPTTLRVGWTRDVLPEMESVKCVLILRGAWFGV